MKTKQAMTRSEDLRTKIYDTKTELNDNKSSSFPEAGPFSGAVFHGGQFNKAINTVNKSPISTDHSTQSTRSYEVTN